MLMEKLVHCKLIYTSIHVDAMEYSIDDDEKLCKQVIIAARHTHGAQQK